MTLDTLIETGKILSYSEGESYSPIGFNVPQLAKVYSTTCIYLEEGKRMEYTQFGTTRKDVTKQIFNYFENSEQ